MQRIVHVICGLDAGGTEMMCVRLADQWRNRFDQWVLALAPNSRMLEPTLRAIVEDRLIVADGTSNARMSSFRWLRSRFHEIKPDAVLFHMFGLHHLVGAAAARAARINRMAASVGNPPPADTSLRNRWSAVLLLSRLVGCPLAPCSMAVERELRQLHVGLPTGSTPIPHGIDLPRFARSAVSPANERHKRVIAMVARLERIKDHRTLLEAFELVTRRWNDLELWLIGDGPMRAELEALAHRLEIADAVVFLGRRTDVADLLAEVDIYAFSTTRDEGFGIALIEALAAGLPVVATDVPACREVLAAGNAGVLVPPHQPSALAEAILSLLGDGARRADLAARARARVSAEYSMERCAERWEQMLLRRPTCEGPRSPHDEA